MTDRPLLSIDNLRAWYRPGEPVLSGFSLKLEAGEAVALIGLNGAGKTTLIKAMAGLLRGVQMDGAAWRGRPLSFRDEGFKREHCVVLDQGGGFGYFTFREYLAYAAAAYGVEKPQAAPLVEGFHFQKYTGVLLKELSAGSRKKAYLITAFALGLPLLLLDEPVNGLDLESTEFLYHLISASRRRGTILFASHILDGLDRVATRGVTLEGGRAGRSFAGEELKPERIREALSLEHDGQSPG